MQQNTLEQLIAFLPGIYLFSHYFSPLVAAALGVVYLIGRELYAYTYVKDPAKRDVGYGMTFLPMVILVAGRLDRRGSRTVFHIQIFQQHTLGWP